MPLVTSFPAEPGIDNRQSELALMVRSGILRGFAESGWVFVPELTLSNGRRVDLIALDQKGMISIIEIKSSINDFRTDQKWHEYKDYCDAFYFASHANVPSSIFPQNEGFILADQHGCELMREASNQKLSPQTRKAVMLRIARTAADRLNRLGAF